ncbi:MAG: flagellar export protein FliJ [Firmicutes bacterium]|jgi:flagellar FliJ protein|nr:flagellar export protein FliJ [Bacillota bacterium]
MYTFSLQKVLDYRKKQEELAQRRLAGALRERDQARLVVEQVQDALSRCQEEYTGLQSPELDLPRLLMASELAGVLTDRLKHSRQELKEKEACLRQEQRRTEKAMQDRKILDKLREKAEREYLKQEERKEQQRMDELARTVFLRTHR